MRLLLDACVSRQLVEALRKQGHDVNWVGGGSPIPGDDETLLQRAVMDQRILVTLD